ncbi:MAG TPA: MerR family transcriptional regulator [Candidatus Aminicenantes bacterium]|nr:MerR family transcriptional regulator [Candidatus Aminicenantes bacterium]
MKKILAANPPLREGPYGCGEVARLIGKHPNTLRQYDAWGFISAVPRRANGYRVYNRRHVLEALLAVTALRVNFQEWQGRRLMREMIGAAVARDFPGAQAALDRHVALLAEARAKLDQAKIILERWRSGKRGPEREIVGRWQAARTIGTAPDTLRDWERSGLITPGRKSNGRRFYRGRDLDRLLVIKVLREGGYSLMGILNLFGRQRHEQDLGFARDKWEETLTGFIADTAVIQDRLDELRHEPGVRETAKP